MARIVTYYNDIPDGKFLTMHLPLNTLVLGAELADDGSLELSAVVDEDAQEAEPRYFMILSENEQIPLHSTYICGLGKGKHLIEQLLPHDKAIKTKLPSEDVFVTVSSIGENELLLITRINEAGELTNTEYFRLLTKEEKFVASDLTCFAQGDETESRYYRKITTREELERLGVKWHTNTQYTL